MKYLFALGIGFILGVFCNSDFKQKEIPKNFKLPEAGNPDLLVNMRTGKTPKYKINYSSDHKTIVTLL